MEPFGAFGPILTRHVDVDVDGDRIAASFCSPAVPSAGIVFVHGWDGCKEQHADCIDEMAANGFACLAFDLRGHQDTDGRQDEVSRPDNLRDLLTMYDWMVGQGMDRSRMGVVGVSYGAYLAALAAALRPIRWLVLRAPALYPDRGWQLPKQELEQKEREEAAGMRKYREQVHAPECSEALSACASFDGHALIVESGRDETIPHAVILSYAQAFVSARSMTCTTIAGADHALSDPEHKRAFAAILGEWLGRASDDPDDDACTDESVIA